MAWTSRKFGRPTSSLHARVNWIRWRSSRESCTRRRSKSWAKRAMRRGIPARARGTAHLRPGGGRAAPRRRNRARPSAVSFRSHLHYHPHYHLDQIPFRQCACVTKATQTPSVQPVAKQHPRLKARKRLARIGPMKNLQRRVTVLAAALSLTAASNARAFEAVDTIFWPSRGMFPAYPADETRPTGVMLEAGVMRDDNVLRTETAAQADTITRVGGAVRHEQRIIGRQRLRLDARGDYYKYDRSTNLDHAAYALAGDWLWEAGNNLAGTLIAGYVQRQAAPSETQTDRLDLVNSATLSGTAAYLITPRLRLRGGLSALKEERTQAVKTESRAATAIAALEYVSPLLNTLGLEYRSTQGEAPLAVGATGNPDYVERELAAVVTYALGAQLRVAGRLGYTSRDYDQETD